MESSSRLRAAVAEAARALAAEGLVRGTSGNLSAREGPAVAITATGAVLAGVGAEEVTVVDFDGGVLEGALAPSSEMGLHLEVYRRYGSGAVVHTHSPAATALACVLERELPCIHYEMLALGGDVPVVPYATFGTAELAAAVGAALDGHAAALLANHGAVVHAPDLAGALAHARLLEFCSDLYVRASATGVPRVLSAAEREDVVRVAVERSYGRTRAAERGESPASDPHEGTPTP